MEPVVFRRLWVRGRGLSVSSRMFVRVLRMLFRTLQYPVVFIHSCERSELLAAGERSFRPLGRVARGPPVRQVSCRAVRLAPEVGGLESLLWSVVTEDFEVDVEIVQE